MRDDGSAILAAWLIALALVVAITVRDGRIRGGEIGQIDVSRPRPGAPATPAMLDLADVEHDGVDAARGAGE